jgi:hypothetical protein
LFFKTFSTFSTNIWWWYFTLKDKNIVVPKKAPFHCTNFLCLSGLHYYIKDKRSSPLVERKGFIWLSFWQVLVYSWLISMHLGLMKKRIKAGVCGREKLLTSCSWSERERGSHWDPIIDHESFNSLHFSNFCFLPNHKSKQQIFSTWVIWETFNTHLVSPIILNFDATIFQYGFTKGIWRSKINQDEDI